MEDSYVDVGDTNYGAKEILKPNGELSYENLRDLTDILETNPQFQQMFLNGDSTDQTQALNNVQKLSQEVDKFKLQRKANALLWSKRNTPGKAFDSDGYSIGLQDYPDIANVLANHNNVDAMGFSTTMDDLDNIIGFNIGFVEEDGSVITSEMARDLSKKFMVDKKSADEIVKIRNLMSDQAKKGNHQSTFDEANVRRAINNIVKGGSQISLIYDPLVKETSLREDLISSGLLSNITYESLGVPNPKGKQGGLTEADQKDLLDNLFKNPALSKQREALITDYYTSLVRQEWDAQHQVHVNNYNNSLAASQRAAKAPTVNGGQLNSKGVFVPNKK